ncbi:S8 family serine peptidase [Paractinoplanes globisporus]|uniref:S8 family serine peptidase n=1 Tax=Paractinoplanes globisporus TaxID=113565 RepID=A0ABW6W8N0_9ACTN|nr:S8 family serine peptidase [Actinoplanes globisporus]
MKLVAGLTGGALALALGVPSLALAAPAAPEAWQVASLKLAAAHKVSRGAGVTVAVLDSGVAAHAQLAGALLPEIDVVAAGDPARGTELAGLIAARDLGVAPQAKILPVRVGAKGFDAGANAVATGIDRAIAAGAKVVVSSYAKPEISPALSAAVRHAVAADVLIVAPAAPTTATTVTLGDLPGVLSVTASDESGRPVRESVSGLRIDVAAPGDHLVAPVHASLGDAYAEVSGADFAAALAGGVAALVRSKYPGLSAADVARRLGYGARRDFSLGHGVIDAADALGLPLKKLPDPKRGALLPRDEQWYFGAVRLTDAQRVTLGEGVALGLVTASVDATRPELTGRVTQQPPWGPAGRSGTEAALVAAGSGGDGLLGAAPAARLIVAADSRWVVDHGAKVVLVVDGAFTEDDAAYAVAHDAVVVAPWSDTAPVIPGVIYVRGVGQDEPTAAAHPPALSAPAYAAAGGGGGSAAIGRGPAAAGGGSATASGGPATAGGGSVAAGGSSAAGGGVSAAALVAGVAALVRAKDPGANANNVVARLLDTATPMTGASATAYGRGIVDPVGALTEGTFSVGKNPLGEPAATTPAADGDSGSRWAWVAVPIVVLVAGLLAWVLLWRHRRRPVVAAEED